MNTTIDSKEPACTTGDTGTDPYGLVFFCVVLFLIITICCSCYIYKSGILSRIATIFISSTNSNNHNHNQGIDDNILVTYPTCVYSEIMMPPEGKSSTDNIVCSICLGDYKPADVIRLLPECNHLFHVKCIDKWLKVHPTCPVCRNSALPAI